MAISEDLPHVLVIDDQFGRCQLGDAFRRSVGREVFSLFEADRANLCRSFGLALAKDGTSQPPIAFAVFSPAQRWNDEAKTIENWPEQAVGAVRQRWPAPDGSRWSLILLDLRFTEGRLNNYGDPERGSLFGAEILLPRLRHEFGDDLPIVVLSSTSREELNQRVRELGALDFIQRIPGAGAPPDHGRQQLASVLFSHGLMPDFTGQVVGHSLPVLKMLRSARRGARSARTMLLEGASGTGKGLLARYIHSHSARSTGPFEVFNPAHNTPELQADELFGHWRGAFTGANSDSPGLWERANGGTLFIDEVASLDQGVQLRLMQPIEERRVRRIGHAPKGHPSAVDVDVRVILATNQSLAELASVKVDFLNRINAFVVDVPLLRERRGDIPALVDALTTMLSPRWQGRVLPDAMAALVAHDWSAGNVRELRNVLERALANNPGQDITVRDIQLQSRQAQIGQAGLLSPREVPHGSSAWESLLRAIDRDPDSLPLHERRALIAELRGKLPILLADSLAWSLRLTAENGRPNHTAAVRFLLGRDDISTVEAKQFIRKCLALDTRGGSVWRRFEEAGAVTTTAVLGEILHALRRRSER